MSSSTAAAAPAPATRSIIYLGMDVHKESITIAVLPDAAKVPTRLEVAIRFRGFGIEHPDREPY